MKNYKSTLKPDGVYHVYNRANGSEKLFLKDTNYLYFLKKFKFYIHPIAEVYCYCLMPNHFHVLLKIRSEESVSKYFDQLVEKKNIKKLEVDQRLTLQFSHLFNTYTKAFNIFYGRMGGLFMSRYNRIPVKDELQFINTVKYIHLNPVQARLVNSPDEWIYSSFKAFTLDSKTLIQKQEVLRYFNDIDNFLYIHGINANNAFGGVGDG
jgi:REP element-mobilizing transposase RayT